MLTLCYQHDVNYLAITFSMEFQFEMDEFNAAVASIDALFDEAEEEEERESSAAVGKFMLVCLTDRK